MVKYYSAVTDVTYPTYEALVAAEAHGWGVTMVCHEHTHEWPGTVGLFDTKKAAQTRAARLRAHNRRTQHMYPNVTWTVYVRPIWKDAP